MQKPTLLMIRPALQAREFVDTFTAKTGKSPDTIFSPVIEISPVVASTVPQNAQFLLFSSVNGVRYFAQQSDNRTVPALCVGDTTANAALAEGFNAQSANGTAQDLIALAERSASKTAGPLVYFCGTSVAFDVDGVLSQRGYQTARQIVYEQSAKPLSAAAQDALNFPAVIPVSSPNTAKFFLQSTADIDLSQATVVCISNRVAQEFAHTNAKVVVSTHPTRASMIAALDLLF